MDASCARTPIPVSRSTRGSATRRSAPCSAGPPLTSRTTSSAGIAFAQHYADTRGHPDPTAWTALVGQYGTTQALCVLRAARTMMWGNALGIPLSSLRARLQGSPDPGSSLALEIGTPLGSLLVTPIALIHALLQGLRGAPIAP